MIIYEVKVYYLTIYSLFLVESAPASPSRSLPNANSVPNLPQQTTSGSVTPTPKPATPTIHLSTPKGNIAKKNSLTSSLTNMMAQLDSSIRGKDIELKVLRPPKNRPTGNGRNLENLLHFFTDFYDI